MEESKAARQRLEADRGAVALCDWKDVVFLHFEVDSELLQPSVPFPLDLLDGKGYVSIVAFDQQQFRTPLLAGLPSPLIRPLGSYPICNLRTYVRCGSEPGVSFIREWEPNPLSALLVPLVYGLPQRVARIRYEHNRQDNAFFGHVVRHERQLVLTAHIDYQAELAIAEFGSLVAFLSDRYTAFQQVGRRRQRFRIWHVPWMQHGIEARVERSDLAHQVGSWWDTARPVAASYSPGVESVQLGRPVRVSC
jgi:uncharacterized protein YqjF (DUF2071 family)